MKLAWCGLIPLGIANFLGVAVILSFDLPKWTLAIFSLVCLLAAAFWSVKQASSKTSRTALSPLTHCQDHP